MDEQGVQMLSDDLYFCTVILTRKTLLAESIMSLHITLYYTRGRIGRDYVRDATKN